MPERSTVFQGNQIGVETTIGTGVAANKLLNTIGLGVDFDQEFDEFTPAGQAVPSAVQIVRDATTIPVEGRPSFSELIYPFSSLFGAATITTVDTTARQWAWAPASRSEITPKSYTVEEGGAVRSHKAAGVIFSGIELGFESESVPTLSGTAFGMNLSDNITLTPGPAAIEEANIQRTMVDLYIDTTSGGLGGTKMTRDFSATWRNNDAFKPIYVLNSANPSWVAPVGTRPVVEMDINLEADTSGMAYLTAARDGSTRFIRLDCTSVALAGAATQKYKLTIDMAGKISAFSFDRSADVFLVSMTWKAVYDATWTKYQDVKLVNKVTAL
jgi:hypothetical protein